MTKAILSIIIITGCTSVTSYTSNEPIELRGSAGGSAVSSAGASGVERAGASGVPGGQEVRKAADPNAGAAAVDANRSISTSGATSTNKATLPQGGSGPRFSIGGGFSTGGVGAGGWLLAGAPPQPGAGGTGQVGPRTAAGSGALSGASGTIQQGGATSPKVTIRMQADVTCAPLVERIVDGKNPERAEVRTIKAHESYEAVQLCSCTTNERCVYGHSPASSRCPDPIAWAYCLPYLSDCEPPVTETDATFRTCEVVCSAPPC